MQVLLPWNVAASCKDSQLKNLSLKSYCLYCKMKQLKIGLVNLSWLSISNLENEGCPWIAAFVCSHPKLLLNRSNCYQLCSVLYLVYYSLIQQKEKKEHQEHPDSTLPVNLQKLTFTVFKQNAWCSWRQVSSSTSPKNWNLSPWLSSVTTDAFQT